MKKTRLELRSSSSNKFWEVWVTDATVTTRWGKLGSAGQTKGKTHGSAAAASAAANKAMAAKLAKGYVEVAAPGSAKKKTTKETIAWLPCVLPIAGEAAGACLEILERAGKGRASSREARARRELLAIVESIAGDRRPRWLLIGEDESEDELEAIAVDLEAPLCWARGHDGDVFYSDWSELHPGPRLVLRTRARPWRGFELVEDEDEDGGGEVALTDAHAAEITDFDPDSTVVYSLEFVGPRPKTLAELARKGEGLERCLGHDVDVLELGGAAVGPVGEPSPHANERGPGRSGAYASTGPTSRPKLKWRSRTRNGSAGGGSEFGAQPLVIDGLIVSSGFSCLSAVDRRGKVKWESARLPGGQAFVGALAGFEDTVIAATFKSVTAFDLATGKPRWSRTIRNPKEGVACDGHLIYFGAGPKLMALDPRTGKTAWTWSPSKKAKVIGVPIVADGRLIFAADDRVLAVSRTGREPELLWRAVGNEYRTSRYDIAVGEAAYVATRKGVAAYDLETGKSRWLAECDARSLAVDPRLGVVVATADPTVGRRLWGIDARTGRLEYDRKHGYGVPSLADGVCYVTATTTSFTTGLAALSVTKGKQLWMLKSKDIISMVKRGYVPESFEGSVPLPLDGKVLVGVDGLWALA